MRIIMATAALALLAGCGGGEKELTQRQQIGSSWKYETKGDAKLAYIGSANTVQTITAPDTFSVLLVQPLDSGGKDITVKLVGAPFTCDLSDCKVMAQVDDGPPQAWKGRVAPTNDGIELLASQVAYKEIAKAKTVKVTLTVGKGQDFPFQFNVAGLDLPS